MATNVYAATGFTGGASGAVDSLKYATLADGDYVIVADSTEAFSVLRFESSSSTSESSPWTTSKVIAPDDVGANNGRWVAADFIIDKVTVLGDIDITGALQLTESSLSDGAASGIKAVFTAGTSLAFPNVCYMGSDGKMEKADADADTTMPVVAMALETIAEDSTGEFLLCGCVRDDDWNWTKGPGVSGLIYASTTAGGLSQTKVSSAGDIDQIVGWATHADRMFFNPNYDYVELT